MFTISNLQSSEKLNLPFDAWKILVSDAVEIVRFRLHSGEIIKTHSNPNNAIFFVINGEAVVNVETKVHRLEKDDLIRIVKDVDRKWENAGSEPLEVLVIKEL